MIEQSTESKNDKKQAITSRQNKQKEQIAKGQGYTGKSTPNKQRAKDQRQANKPKEATQGKATHGA